SRELVALEPDKVVTAIDAILLTGGSAFGLAAADGVMRFLEAAGRGVATPAGRVPIVPTMALFDLAVGDASVRPDAAAGYAGARRPRAAARARRRRGRDPLDRRVGRSDAPPPGPLSCGPFTDGYDNRRGSGWRALSRSSSCGSQRSPAALSPVTDAGTKLSDP